MRDEPNEAWKNRIKWYFENDHLKDLNRIDGKPTEFEWNMFQDSQRWASSKRFTNLCKIFSVNVSSSTTGSSSCQCTMTLHGETKEIQKM